MNKQKFLTELEKGLAKLPKDDLQEQLFFYSEMIDDRMEDGIPEEDAVMLVTLSIRSCQMPPCPHPHQTRKKTNVNSAHGKSRF